jgi:hypothetical protein
MHIQVVSIKFPLNPYLCFTHWRCWLHSHTMEFPRGNHYNPSQVSPTSHFRPTHSPKEFPIRLSQQPYSKTPNDCFDSTKTPKEFALCSCYKPIQVSHTWYFGPTHTQGDSRFTCNLPYGAIPPTITCSKQIVFIIFYVHVQADK